MIIEPAKDGLDAAKADLLALGLHEGKTFSGEAAALDRALGGHLRPFAEHLGFSGKAKQKLVMHTHGKIAPPHVALIGLGPRKAFDAEAARRAGGAVVRAAGKVRAGSAAVSLPLPAGTVQAFLEGMMLADYRFERYRKTRSDMKEARGLELAALRLPPGMTSAAFKKAAAAASAHADATAFARDLVNTPAADMTPRQMAKEAEGLAKAWPGRLSARIFGRKELKKMGAGGILGIAQGSDEEPYLVHLAYKPPRKARKRVALVGKGVTFDSGGLSLKPSQSMEDMKIDMGGAAAVFGVFHALPKLLPAVEVHGVAALVENMPSGKAIRPGDIVTTMSGKTVEILNTDAEGRVTLADSLHYAASLKPDMMVDLATLTGACMVALGQDYAGLLSDDERLSARLLAASKLSGERLWPLPLAEEYAEEIKSRHADLKNVTSSRYGGAITAGLFLKEFSGTVPWAHLDIAGPSYAEKETLSYHAWGASGFGVRTLLSFIMSL